MSRLIFPTISSLKKETGINSYLVKLPFRNSILVGVLISAGFINEKWPEEKGFAHFLEHLVLRGTKKFPNAKLLNKSLEIVGGGKEGLTNVEYTLFRGITPHNYSSRLFEILSEIIYRPLITPSSIKKEIKVIQEELKGRSNNLSIFITDILKKTIFDEDIFGPVTVEIPDVFHLSRENILSFWNKYYKNNKKIIVIIGNISTKEAITNIKKFFSKEVYLFNKPTTLNGKASAYEFKKGVKKIIKSPLINEQIFINMAAPVRVSTPKEMLTLHLYNTMLSYGVTSPFFQELREKRGLVYKISTEIIEYSIPLFRISFTSSRDYEKITKLIFKIIKDNSRSVTALKEAKQKLIGRWLIGLDNPDFILKNIIRDINLFGQPLDFSTAIKEIEKISLKDVRQLVEKFLETDKFYSVIVKPVK